MRAATASALAGEWDALVACRSDLIADPYALYGRLREQAPVFRAADQVVVTGFAEVSAILVDATRFLSGHAGLRSSRIRLALDTAPPEARGRMVEILEFRGGGLNHVNGETHARLRALAHHAFTPRMVAALRGRVEALADELLDAVAPSGRMEVISDLAFHLPLVVICELLDVPTADQDRLRGWANDIAAFQDGSNLAVLEDTHRSMFALRDHLHEIFERRRGGPTTDLMGALLATGFPEDELLPVVAHFVFAGHETTTNLIGNGLRALLLEHRDEWERLREDAALVPNAVEELLRYDGPVQVTNRTAAADCEVGGVEIRRWDTIALVLGAANRDPVRFSEPDRLDVGRADARRHTGFGLGPHFCLGAALTRLEVEVVLERLLARFPDLRVEAEVRYRPDHRLRGVEALPVVF